MRAGCSNKGAREEGWGHIEGRLQQQGRVSRARELGGPSLTVQQNQRKTTHAARAPAMAAGMPAQRILGMGSRHIDRIGYGGRHAALLTSPPTPCTKSRRCVILVQHCTMPCHAMP
eukprot:363017-Chlamydomonas_euryale.AAC.12